MSIPLNYSPSPLELHEHLSIPGGAIETCRVTVAGKKKDIFQYPEVRLKHHPSARNAKASIHFQYPEVRLKPEEE